MSRAINLLLHKLSQQKVIAIMLIWGRKHISEHFGTMETTSGNTIMFVLILP